MKNKMIYWKKDIQHTFNLCIWGYLLVIGIIKRELHQNVILLHIRYKYKCHMFFIFTFSCFKSLCALALIPRWLIRLHEVIHNIIFFHLFCIPDHFTYDRFSPSIFLYYIIIYLCLLSYPWKIRIKFKTFYVNHFLFWGLEIFCKCWWDMAAN